MAGGDGRRIHRTTSAPSSGATDGSSAAPRRPRACPTGVTSLTAAVGVSWLALGEHSGAFWLDLCLPCSLRATCRASCCGSGLTKPASAAGGGTDDPRTGAWCRAGCGDRRSHWPRPRPPAHTDDQRRRAGRLGGPQRPRTRLRRRRRRPAGAAARPLPHRLRRVGPALEADTVAQLLDRGLFRLGDTELVHDGQRDRPARSVLVAAATRTLLARWAALRPQSARGGR